MTTSALLRILQDNPPKLIANGLRCPEIVGNAINFQRGFTSRDDMILMLGHLPEARLYVNWQEVGTQELKQMWLK